MELVRVAERGLAEQRFRQREHAPLPRLVGGNGVEHAGQPIGRLPVNRERRRQQLRHLQIVEAAGEPGADVHDAAVSLRIGGAGQRWIRDSSC